MSIEKMGMVPPENEPKHTSTPEFLREGEEDLNEVQRGFYQSFTPDKDLKPLLLEHLDRIGKKMPDDGELPEFMHYTGVGFDFASDEKEEIHMDAEGQNVKEEWESWLAKCPSK